MAGRVPTDLGRVRVSPAGIDDLPVLTDIYNHYVQAGSATFDTTVFTVAERRPWFDAHASTGPHRLLVAERSGRPVGWASSSVFRSRPAYAASVETSLYLDPDATGRGVGTRLYRELLSELGRAGVHRAYAAVALPNDASEALHRRLGYREVGTMSEVGRKFDRWWDVRWYELSLAPTPLAPTPPPPTPPR